MEQLIGKKLYKVFNSTEHHHNHQYEDGLNILKEKFNDDPKASCCAGGFYFTDEDNLYKYVSYGDHFREVTLPYPWKGGLDQPASLPILPKNINLKIIKDSDGDKWRSNMIILLPQKFFFNDPHIYSLFESDNNAFLVACAGGNENVVKLFLSNRDIYANLDTRKAVSKINIPIDIIELFIKNNIPVDIGEYIIHAATKQGKLEVIKYGVEINSIIEDDLHRLVQKSAKHGHKHIVKYLVKQGADIKMDNAALKYSILYKHSNITRYLIKHGANFGGDFNDMLTDAVNIGNLDLIKYLINNGVNIHENINKLLCYSARTEHINIIEYLLQRGADIHYHNDYPIYTSSIHGQTETIIYLISRGANIHAYNDFVFLRGIDLGDLKLLSYLVQREINVTLDNDAALRHSASHGQLDVVQFLVYYGANIHVNNDEVFRTGTPEVIEFLKSIV